MYKIRYTFLSDGSSDRALLPILTWLLQSYFRYRAIHAEYADLRRLPKPPKTLPDRIIRAIELFPCDWLFIQRDAENQTLAYRKEEIQNAISAVPSSVQLPPIICVIPVRMAETWLLFDEAAIRKASGNPTGKIQLSLPVISQLEFLSNPKSTLYELIKRASELRGRRLKKLRVNKCVHRLAELIDDFTPLRQLPAFNSLEIDLRELEQRDPTTDLLR